MMRNGLYFYCHQRTRQLLIALSPAHLRSSPRISHPSERTPPLRRDLWTPLLIATSSSPVFRKEVALGLRQSLLSNPGPSASIGTLRKRREQEKNDQEVETRLMQLCQVLHRWERNRIRKEKEVPEVVLYWQEEGWKDWVKEKLGQDPTVEVKDWPAFVKHEKLELHKGRHIMNPELTNAPPATTQASIG